MQPTAEQQKTIDKKLSFVAPCKKAAQENDSIERSLKRVAVLNDISCFGKCSLTVALPVISALGVEAVPIPTALLSTHTGGFKGYTKTVLTRQMQGIINHFKQLDLKFDCIYTGYFCSKKQIEIAEEFINDFKTEQTTVIVDPVMGDGGELYAGFGKSEVKALGRLCEKADFITPNFTEAAFLAGEDGTENTDSSKLLKKLPGRNVIITGVPFEDEIGYHALINEEEYIKKSQYIGGVKHGCGDVFASALAANIAKGKDGAESFFNAAEFCSSCVTETGKLTDHFYGLAFEKMLGKKWDTD